LFLSSFFFFLLDYLHQEFRKENLLVQYGRREDFFKELEFGVFGVGAGEGEEVVLVYGWVECKGDVLGKWQVGGEAGRRRRKGGCFQWLQGHGEWSWKRLRLKAGVQGDGGDG
jgi:hypothetical protein